MTFILFQKKHVKRKKKMEDLVCRLAHVCKNCEYCIEILNKLL